MESASLGSSEIRSPIKLICDDGLALAAGGVNRIGSLPDAVVSILDPIDSNDFGIVGLLVLRSCCIHNADGRIL